MIYLLIQDLLLTKEVVVFNEKLKVLNAMKDPNIQIALKKNTAEITAKEKLLLAIQAAKQAAESLEPNSAQEFNQCLIHVLSILESKQEQEQLMKQLFVIVENAVDFGLKIRKMGFIKSVSLVSELSGVGMSDESGLFHFGFLINLLEGNKHVQLDIKILQNNIMLNLLFTESIKVFNEKLQLLRRINDPRIKIALEIGAKQNVGMVNFFIEFYKKPFSETKIPQLELEAEKKEIASIMTSLKRVADEIEADSETKLQTLFDKIYLFLKPTTEYEIVSMIQEEMHDWYYTERDTLEKIFKSSQTPFTASQTVSGVEMVSSAVLAAPPVTAAASDHKSDEKRDYKSNEMTSGSGGLPAVASLNGLGFSALHQRSTAAAGTAANAVAGVPQSGNKNTLVIK